MPRLPARRARHSGAGRLCNRRLQGYGVPLRACVKDSSEGFFADFCWHREVSVEKVDELRDPDLQECVLAKAYTLNRSFVSGLGLRAP